ncbi:hypothetical protein [uncultured Methylobacterium sp.]|uniref:hypothetical protein n=1 Tax=uncultured Methylobacterium sp. TaxID=157278 RepID=UPI002585A109|nr:hypothetical protein [uncultured Methylobacterium sp.]
MVDGANLPLVSVFDDAQRQFFGSDLAKAENLAREFAKKDNRKDVNYFDAFRALEEQFGKKETTEEKVPWLRENAFLIIISFMTLLFGIMGIMPYFISPNNPEKFGFKPEAFLDMAKLFAGVIVGGAAGATVASNTIRRTKN